MLENVVIVAQLSLPTSLVILCMISLLRILNKEGVLKHSKYNAMIKFHIQYFFQNQGTTEPKNQIQLNHYQRDANNFTVKPPHKCLST